VNIAGLIGIAIAIVVGVALVPVVVDTVNSLDTTTTPSTVLNLADLLPIVFIAILIIGAVGQRNKMRPTLNSAKTGKAQVVNPVLAGRISFICRMKEVFWASVETLHGVFHLPASEIKRKSDPSRNRSIQTLLSSLDRNEKFIAYAVTG